MFIIQLKFGDNKARAGEHMDGHNQWIQQGFADGVFLLVGSLLPSLGGAVLAHNITRDDLESRVSLDPFVIENIVSAEIMEISPAKVDERLAFIQ